MNELGLKFISGSRHHLSKDFLPKIERCVQELSDEQIWWRPNPGSNSIGNLMLHLSGNVRQWIVAGLGEAKDSRDRDSEFAQREVVPRDRLLSLLRQTVNEADQTLNDFDADRLLDHFEIQGSDVAALEAILHVVEHFSMHAGQIIFLTKLLTATDLKFYDFEKGKPLLRV